MKRRAKATGEAKVMRIIGFLVVLVGIVGAAAFLTKPSEADAEATLEEQVMMAVAKRDLGKGQSTAENLALAACKLRPSDCYELLRSGVETAFTDHTVYVKFTLDGFDRTAECYGAFGRFVCPGGLKRK